VSTPGNIQVVVEVPHSRPFMFKLEKCAAVLRNEKMPPIVTLLQLFGQRQVAGCSTPAAFDLSQRQDAHSQLLSTLLRYESLMDRARRSLYAAYSPSSSESSLSDDEDSASDDTEEPKGPGEESDIGESEQSEDIDDSIVDSTTIEICGDLFHSLENSLETSLETMPGSPR
jgi:hypothetical protein